MTRQQPNNKSSMTPDIAEEGKRIQYLSDPLVVLLDVYEPCDDTYLLLDAALREVRPTDSVLEVGTGCGIIAKMLTKRARSVVAIDKNPHAVVNAKLNGVEAFVGDLFASLHRRYDLVVFNPPYLPSQSSLTNDWQTAAWDGGVSGREVIEQFLAQASDYLTREGRILLVISSVTGHKEVTKLMRAQFKRVRTVAKRKFFFEMLYVLLGAETIRQ